MTKPHGLSEFTGTIIASDIEWKEPLVVIEGLRTASLENIGDRSPARVNSKSLKRLGSLPVWDIDIDHLPLGIAQPLFERLGNSIPDADPKLIQDLELASLIFSKRIVNYFSHAEAASFASHHQLFYEYMQHRYDLAKDGKLECQEGDLSWIDTTREFEDALLQRVSRESIDGKLLCHHCHRLPEILTGKVEPLQLLREEDLLTEYYRTTIGTNKYSPIVTEYVRKLSHKRPLRILEIGAGTGGTTSVVLRALGRQNEAVARLQAYTFTDISPGFFEAATEDFKEWATLLEFKILDIEKDPLDQGIEAGSYDLVIANNVLHATHSVGTCLENCRKVLKPNGRLLLGENTSKLARVPMIFGTLPGWWNGENDNRKWGPTLLEHEWNSLLIEKGFNGLEMCFRDHSRKGWHCVSLMISSPAPIARTALPKNIVIIKPTEGDEESDALHRSLVKALEGEATKVDAVDLLDVLAMDLTDRACISLLEVKQPLLHRILDKEFDPVKRLLLSSKSLLWLTSGATMESPSPEGNMIAGLGRTIRGEVPGIQLTTLDVEPSTFTSPEAISAVKTILRSGTDAVNASRSDWEYALRGGLIHSIRLYPHQKTHEVFEIATMEQLPTMQPFKQPDQALALKIRLPGMLDTFQWGEDEEWSKPMGDLDVEISVQAVGMNFHDLMVSLGQMADFDLGLDCSGIVTRVGKDVMKYKPGDRVLTGRLGCFRTYLRSAENLFQRIPDSMSFVEAASIPSIYCTVYYSLFDLARLRKNESILIHSAAGGVGQGAIIFSQHIGAEIFVTVSSEAKKRFLIETYNIPEDHIFNSRDYSFASGVKRMTNNKGVNVILNSLAGEGLRQTWQCLAEFGRFIELGKTDIGNACPLILPRNGFADWPLAGNTGLEMGPFDKNVLFAGFDLLHIWRKDSDLLGRLMVDVMRALAEGIIRPVEPLTVMTFSKLEEAFRIMQAGKHVGKIILTPEEHDNVPV